MVVSLPAKALSEHVLTEFLVDANALHEQRSLVTHAEVIAGVNEGRVRQSLAVQQQTIHVENYGGHVHGDSCAYRKY